jgi:translation initiation factor IF-2
MTIKVFELAKELDIGSLELVDKLKKSGFTVRNHMTVLSDDEMVKARGLYEEVKPMKSTSKKKTTKKKVVKKKKVVAKAIKVEEKIEEKPEHKVDGKVGKTADVEEANDKKTASSKKTTKKSVKVRSKSILRKKSDSSKDESTTDSFLQEAQVGEDQESVQNTQESESGLRVVFDPSTKEKVEEVKVESTSKDSDDLKPKLHRFTPVYIPEEKEKSAPESNNKVQKDDVNAKVVSPNIPGEAGDALQKKRLGDLAAMVSKGKVVNKSQNLEKMRSEEELKNYAGGSFGKSVYIPAKRKRAYVGPKNATIVTEVKDSKRIVHIHDSISAKELSNKLSVKFETFRNDALKLNLLIKESDVFGLKLSQMFCGLYNYKAENKAFDENSFLDVQVIESKNKSAKNSPLRDPIITIMGHVDHGKTTLIDYIRNAKVASSEAGGITQHIGAYSVELEKSKLTFLDTPGHAAFGAMRARGAKVTDIVILVVAVDDGVMPQTKESIRFCKEADVPIIVAVNKMDKEGANPEKIKQALLEFELTAEEWGGDTQFIEIAAIDGQGVDKLLEAVSVQAEIMELKADPKRAVKGISIESRIETGRGPIATLLVQEGTLKKGDTIVIGESYGRARSLMDYKGNMLQSAGPSTPVQVLGLHDAPEPGDIFHKVKNEREAKKVVDNRINERHEIANVKESKKMSLEDFFGMTSNSAEEMKVLKLIVRSDVNGSFEAIKNAAETYRNEEVRVEVIGGGVGPINENDVNLASSSEGFIIGFNMRPITSARRLAENLGVDIKTYSIIYEVLNDIKLALEGMLQPEKIEKYIGRAEVKDLFSVPKVGTIAGSSVIDGKILRGCNIRLLREGKIIFDGKMSSLKRFKDDVKEVGLGYECGIGLDSFNDIKSSDIFEAYLLEEKKREFESDATL